MEFFLNIILSILVFILVYLLLDLYDSTIETFSNCITEDKLIYMNNIKNIKENLNKDGYLYSKSLECNKLLDTYNTILCDLKNVNNDNFYEIKIISHLNIPIETNNKIDLLEIIIDKCINITESYIDIISDISKEETEIKYKILNKQIFNSIKQEIIIKIL